MLINYWNYNDIEVILEVGTNILHDTSGVQLFGVQNNKKEVYYLRYKESELFSVNFDICIHHSYTAYFLSVSLLWNYNFMLSYVLRVEIFE